ncbi:AAA family ATPase [Streptomyces sp. NPDC005077]|uniref:AAA family ATPase n=1 Tax=Streptomyces sp. NPDC005077 TaxID=3154292 RepID=UPI0033A06494
MASRLKFLSLTVTTADTEKTYSFDQPATVISGPSGSGKSSLLMLLKYAIGGTAILTPAVRDHVHSVRAEILVGQEPLVLKRMIGEDGRNRIDVLDPTTMDLRQSLIIRAEAGIATLSDHLLDTLGFPREAIPTRRDGKAATLNVTFADLFAYVYLEAINIDTQIVRHHEHFNPKRQALFKMMFGLTDSALLKLQRLAGQLLADMKAKKAEHESVSNFLAASDSRSDDALRAELVRLREMLQLAETALGSLRSELEESSAADAVLRRELRQAVAAARDAAQEVAAARELVEARQAVVAQVELDLLRLERSATAIEKLSPFDFVVCPRCMQRLESRPVEEDHCIVCLQHDPPDESIDPAAIQQTRETLEKQLLDAQSVLEGDTQVLDTARDRAQQADFLATTLRRQLDAQTRDVVAPRFDAIADSSARVAALGASIDAVTELRDAWSRARSIAQTVKDIKARRARTQAAIKSQTAALAERGNLVSDLSLDFHALLTELHLPWVQTAVVDPDTYLPVVDGDTFDSLQASGGGIKTCVSIAYSLALLEFGLTHPDVLVPSLLIIDSPRKALGNNPDDQERGRRIYSRFKALADTYGHRVQLIIADNDTAPIPSSTFSTIPLDYTHPMVPGVTHPGPEHTRRAEDDYGA